MKIFGIGTDIVKTNRIQKLLRKENILEKLFNEEEIIKCKRIKKNANCFAKRFAAKEAFSKALGTGISKGLSFKDIEILNNKKGKPILNINGKSKKIVKKFIKKRFKTFVSLSDEKSHAIASVIISIN